MDRGRWRSAIGSVASGQNTSTSAYFCRPSASLKLYVPRKGSAGEGKIGVTNAIRSIRCVSLVLLQRHDGTQTSLNRLTPATLTLNVPRSSTVRVYNMRPIPRDFIWPGYTGGTHGRC